MSEHNEDKQQLDEVVPVALYYGGMALVTAAERASRASRASCTNRMDRKITGLTS